MYGYVTTIGLGRMADGWHWTSDTIAGAVMGFAIGKAISDRQSARASARVRDQSLAAPIRIPIWSLDF
jgi:membrane-associated phospholipid phosphatase